MDTVDAAIVGGGTAGLTVAAGMAGFGLSVLLIEQDRLGGDCLSWGCVPTKALVRAAAVAHTVREARRYGIAAGSPEVDLPAVMRRVAEVQAEVGRRDSAERFRALGVDVAHGGAAFAAGDWVQAGGRRVRARRIVLATGSRSTLPPIPGLAEAGAWTHVEALQMTALPASLAVLGAGPIGMEFAQIFRRLGTDVTVLEMADAVLAREDPEAAAVVQERLAAEGVRFVVGARVLEVRGGPPSTVVRYGRAGALSEVTVERVLVATGRRANSDVPGIERLGVEATPKGVGVDAYLRTAAPHVWAAGDVTGGLQFTHVAAYQAKLVVRNALFPLKARVDTSAVAWTTYTDPELARVGLTEAEARERLGPVDVFRYPFSDVDRAVIDGRCVGHVKIVADRRGRIVGAHVVGADAGDLIQEIVLAMAAGVPVGRIAQTVHAYPSRTEGVLRASEAYWRERMFGSGPTASVLRWLARRGSGAGRRPTTR